MRAMMMLFFLCAPAAAEDSPITKVVKLLQDMLDQSKEDGVTDRELYAKFKCFCDTETKSKSTSIAEAEDSIETMEAENADLRASNTAHSQQVAKLETDIADNEQARTDADTNRGKENVEFGEQKTELETGISQLARAIDLLAAVGADQTDGSAGFENQQIMAAGATAAAKAPEGSFLASKGKLNALSADMKSALRAASVFLTNTQRTQVTNFLQGPQNDNYSSQSGEIVGIIKSMHDTFQANLASAIQVEDKAKVDYDSWTEIALAEHGGMETKFDDKKAKIGEQALSIASTQGELDTVNGQKTEDENFLADLTKRCATKKTQYEHRQMLRSGEDAAIAQAIAILNSDAAFATMGGNDATSFVQISSEQQLVGNALSKVLAAGKKAHSMRLAKIASAITAGNPLAKVLEMIRNTITVIEEEGTSDTNKHSLCETEQSENNEADTNKKGSIQNLDANIAKLDNAISLVEENIRLATSDLADNLDTTTLTTKTRQDKHALFNKNLKNQQDAQVILQKAIEVLTKYYAFLKSHTATKTYTEHVGKDAGGGNLERLSGKSTEELEEACNAKPECVGFNSAGWLKSSLADESEWYAWDEGSLFVKVVEGALLQQPVEGEPESFGDADGVSTGQADAATGDGGPIALLTEILGDAKAETDNTIQTEKSEQNDFEGAMTALTAQKGELESAKKEYELTLAERKTQQGQAHKDLKVTTDEDNTILAYLASIKPGCDFIQENIEQRKTNRQAETDGLNAAITALEASPAFTAAEANAAREALGKCAAAVPEGETPTPCSPEGPGRGHAECEACVEGVTVFGWCQRNQGEPGCEDPTASSSAGALA